MSVREENKENKNCPSRGLGLAAAAIGVGVGAALYYFFNKRPENPDEEGSTSTWECQQDQAFVSDELEEDFQHRFSCDSYTTLSEHSTTDTSMHESPLRENHNCNQYTTDDDEMETSNTSISDSDSNASTSSDESVTVDSTDNDSFETSVTMSAVTSDGSDSDTDVSMDNTGVHLIESTQSSMVEPTSDPSDREWDLTFSVDVPEDTRPSRSMFLTVLDNLFSASPRNIKRRRARNQEQMLRAQALSEEEQLKCLRNHAFRERSWSLEECSICFEVILKDQEVMALPCTHHFHTACILPWLQEQQTCPNCRTVAE